MYSFAQRSDTQVGSGQHGRRYRTCQVRGFNAALTTAIPLLLHRSSMSRCMPTISA
jgi:hypothetical protein